MQKYMWYKAIICVYIWIRPKNFSLSQCGYSYPSQFCCCVIISGNDGVWISPQRLVLECFTWWCTWSLNVLHDDVLGPWMFYMMMYLVLECFTWWCTWSLNVLHDDVLGPWMFYMMMYLVLECFTWWCTWSLNVLHGDVLTRCRESGLCW